jgi:uracil-DNA glycosylase
MAPDLPLVHDSWYPILDPVRSRIQQIFNKISDREVAPPLHRIFAAFSVPVTSVKVVIVGQDPYPTKGHAHGLAFSVAADVKPLPRSLVNIFTELHSDLQIPTPHHGDLSKWSERGVLLLNRVLTTEVGESNSHAGIGWQSVTDHVCRELGNHNLVAILWGKSAAELSRFFTYSIIGVHPSPLSAHRGFFGSRPFSTANEMLVNLGIEPIDWRL